MDPNHWNTLRRGGILPYLPVHISDTKHQANPEYHDLRRISDGKREYGEQWLDETYVATLSPYTGFDPSAISYVVNGAVADAKAEAFDALTTWAELPQTSRMLASRFNGVLGFGLEAMTTAVRRNARRPWRIPEEFNNLWLEYRYGWRPLMSDVNNVVKHLLEVQMSYNRGRQTQVIDVSATNGKLIHGTARDISSLATRSGTLTLRGYAFATGKFGVDPQFQPITTAWELVPYSFVVDWFLDIGSFIQAAVPIPGVDLRASGYSISEQVESETTWWSMSSGVPNWEVTSSSNGRYYTKVSNYSRVPAGVSIPRFYPRLNTLRVVDLVSLVYQRSAPVVRRLYHNRR